MSIHKLSTSDFESDYILIAIHSQSEPYKLAYEINLKLNTSLKKSSFDISFKNKVSAFDLYKHESEIYNTKLYLISNKSVKETNLAKNMLLFNDYSISSFLIPELKKVEFLMKIEGGGFNIDSLLIKLNKIDSVVSCYRASINNVKSKYNLIFE
tara:strand:- start:2149 stop:2610 length:462 start_codon:yes stop_codon:yes gene_type:complete